MRRARWRVRWLKYRVLSLTRLFWLMMPARTTPPNWPDRWAWSMSLATMKTAATAEPENLLLKGSGAWGRHGHHAPSRLPVQPAADSGHGRACCQRNISGGAGLPHSGWRRHVRRHAGLQVRCQSPAHGLLAHMHRCQAVRLPHGLQGLIGRIDEEP